MEAGGGQENMDIVSLLFHYDLDTVLQLVFLSLDSTSLKRSRCVCHQWDQFIRRRLWASRPARRRLGRRLARQWRELEPQVTRIDTGSSDVNFLAVDNGLAVTNVHCPLSTDKVCGYTRDASARVFHLPSGRALHSLNCAPAGPAPLDPRVMRPVQLSLGRNIIATVVDVEHEAAVMTGEAGGGDVVSVWDRTDGRLLYQGRPHGPGVSVLGLAVQGDAVLTGGGTGRLARVEEGPEGWAAGHLLEGSGQEVTHLECDGRWAVAGSRREARLWDLAAGAVAGHVRPVMVKVWARAAVYWTGQVWMLALSFPHIFIVGGADWSGLQVWHLLENRRVRWILDNIPLHNIHLAGNLITVSEFKDGFNMAEDPENQECLAVVLDAADLVNEKLLPQQVWSRQFSVHPGGLRDGQINAATNDTSLIVAHDTFITLFNFWPGAPEQE